MISVRLITLDHYMAKPVPEISGNQQSKQWLEPVLRIFGPTPDGVKTCLHIHGVYPYMYVPYEGGENPERDALLLAVALDQALLTNANQRYGKFVYKVIPVSGIPLYGYHSKQRQFFKIYFFNPHQIKKASDLLLSGAILSQKFQPHESHIPYTLQFMMDYNIYGMSLVTLSKVKYRRNPDNPDSLNGIDNEAILPLHVKPISYSYWEVDGLAEDIVNRERNGTIGVNPGLVAIWEDEKARRRGQEKPSQITPQSTQSRPEVKLTSTELLHKERLAKRLKDIVLEQEEPSAQVSVGDPDEPRTPYPAEVPESRKILEASLTEPDDGNQSPITTEDLGDLSLLINEKILSQMVASQTLQDSDSETEQIQIEDDSVLGRNQEDEVEAEPEEEDGVDMTQPLDNVENVINDFDANPNEQGKISSDSEDEFWKKMADRIFQFDGAEDSSSASEDDTTGSTAALYSNNLMKPSEDLVERILSNPSPNSESLSNWSNNIMSILSEPSGFSTPQSSICQTPQSFWSNWPSSKIHQTESFWSPENNADGWSWEKNESDRNAFSSLPFDEMRPSNDASKSTNELYVAPFPANQVEYFHGNYTPTSTLSPESNVSSVYTLQATSSILTPASESDDVNLDSASQISPSPPDPVLKNNSPNNEAIAARKKEKYNNRIKELVESLKSWENKTEEISLPLKQYIKSCDEIVNVDFKTVNSKEMVVIEYKPKNSKSSQSKFLIKPLDKFLEEWNNAERKMNDSSKTVRPKLINGFTKDAKVTQEIETKQLSSILNTLEHKYTGDWSSNQIKSIKNKFIVKSIEMLPESTEEKSIAAKLIKQDNSYKVNESVLSNGKIKMRLVKSEREIQETERKNNVPVSDSLSLKRSKVKKPEGSFYKAPEVDSSFEKNKEKFDRIKSVHKLKNDLRSKVKSGKDGQSEDGRKSKKVVPSNCDKNRINTDRHADFSLIEQINRSFEDYFKNIVKTNGGSKTDSKNVNQEEDSDDNDEEEEEEDEDEEAEEAAVEESSSGSEESEDETHQVENEAFNTDSVKFVSQLLSAFSSLSRSGNVPPLSITINLGNPSNAPAVPIQLNLQPNKPQPEKKKNRRNKIENVDGPNDSSSSDDSFHATRTPPKKRSKKDAAYKPLNIIFQKSPKSVSKSESSTNRKRRVSVRSAVEEVVAKSSTCSSKKGVRSIRYSDSPGVQRGSQEESRKCNTRSSSEKEITFEDLTKLGKSFASSGRPIPIVKGRLTQSSSSSVSNEPDFIMDSDDERCTFKKRILNFATTPVKIPQTDVIVSSSEEEEKEEQKAETESAKKRKFSVVILESDETSKSAKSQNSVEAVIEEVDLTVDDEDGSEEEDRGIISFYDKTMLDMSDLDKDETGSEHSEQYPLTQPLPKSQESNQSSDLFPSQTSQASSKGSQDVLNLGGIHETVVLTPTGREIENIPSSSDDSLRLAHVSPLGSPEKSSPVSPAKLSGTPLFADRDSPLEEVAEAGAEMIRIREESLIEEDSFSRTMLFQDDDGNTTSLEMTLVPFGNSTTYIPKRRPPTFLEVKESLSDLGITENSAQNPFYSDPQDVSKTIEIGCRVLKVENYSIAGLKTHKSSLEVVGIEERRKNMLNFNRKTNQSIRSSLVCKRPITITPLYPPPTAKEVLSWSKIKKTKKEKSIEKTHTKILVPRSPGQDSGSEEDLSLTLTPTPCSPYENEKTPSTKSEPVAGPSGVPTKRRVSFDESSISSTGSTPTGFREEPLHSTPYGRKAESPNLGLRKGPLAKIKGRKRLSLLGKMKTIAEEESKAEGKPKAEEKPEAEAEAKPEENEVAPLREERDSSLRKSLDSNSSSKDIFGSDKTKLSDESSKHGPDYSFQIQGVTLDNSYGFKNSVEFLQKAKAVKNYDYTSMLVMELHVQTRGKLNPDPQHDPIRAIFYTFTCDSPALSHKTGIVVVGESTLVGTAVDYSMLDTVNDEAALLEKVIELTRKFDPDILGGYEIEMNSWGYLIQRGYILEKNILAVIGRTLPEENPSSRVIHFSNSQNEEYDDAPKNIREMRIPGRIVLDIWRLLRHEIALTSYTFENVTFHLTHERHPRHSFEMLSQLWEHRTPRLRHVVVDYYLNRVEGAVRILDQLDFISRNSELARLFGIQFYEVLSRGSQFRVESMMLRLAKPLNYIPTSPSIQQRAAMRAPASLPLIMEPESRFYADPVIVLDFQSLYPSVIIAYNYCFSTCLGRVEVLGGREPFKFGCTQLQISPEELKSLENDINISPAGVAFVKENIRKGVLPRMLQEILETRLMVKKSMKDNKGNKVLQKVLHARQLGLKLIANVTYGYTAANFSGRMPATEVGDSVVSKGRETLQRAIQMVTTTKKWGAVVVYGDTDSLFVMTPGKSRKEAFQIGAEIAEAVTQDNPKPVKLKLEKVYQPCILQTKKRYVGYMYESADQETPVYDAKGIETVRRDGCPATAKILQKALQILFETKDVSLVKKFTVRQFSKLIQGRVNIQDLIFAKEYRGRNGYRPGACVPALQLARQWTQTDKRAEPRKKERVPYVIVNGPPGVPLIRLVRSPRDLFADPSLRINAAYYITKAIVPPMQRCFSLLGADVMSWYAEMPRKYHKIVRSNIAAPNEKQKKCTISQYFATVECLVCSDVTTSPICPKCQSDSQKLSVVLSERVRYWERSHAGVMKLCESCSGRSVSNDCASLDCPVLYRRHQSVKDLDQVPVLRQVLDNYLSY